MPRPQFCEDQPMTVLETTEATHTKFKILSRWSGAVKFECELTAHVARKSYGFCLGLAVRNPWSMEIRNVLYI
jgi:hypothetical protein